MANTEGMKAQFIVLNKEHLKKHVSWGNKVAFHEALDDVHSELVSGRMAEGKNPDPTYLVINTDEPYADEVIEILKKHGHWG